MRKPTSTWFAGPPPAWPRPLDALGERWAALGARPRMLALFLVAAMAVAGVQWRLGEADRRWGGPPVEALIAIRDLPVGSAPTDVRPVRLPAPAVPPSAVTELPANAVLALALPAGAILTAAHIDPRGPAAGLPEDLRAVPVAVDEGWGVSAGGWVDVWVTTQGETAARLVARSRPVLEVSGGTALVGLGVDEVSAVTAALGTGRVLLAHAPPPSMSQTPQGEGS